MALLFLLVETVHNVSVDPLCPVQGADVPSSRAD